MNYLNSLPNYLGFLTGMSKFFKWLKKEKQHEEPSVVDQTPIQTTIEQVNSEPELIENDNSISTTSTSNEPIAKPNGITQPQQTVTTTSSESTIHTQRTSKIEPSTIENNYSNDDPTAEKTLERGKEVVDPESSSAPFVTQDVITNNLILDNNVLEENEERLDPPPSNNKNLLMLKRLDFLVS